MKKYDYNKEMICVDSGTYFLTKGKSYKIQCLFEEYFDNIDDECYTYYVVNDKGHRHIIEINKFMSISDYRNLQIDNII